MRGAGRASSVRAGPACPSARAVPAGASPSRTARQGHAADRLPRKIHHQPRLLAAFEIVGIDLHGRRAGDRRPADLADHLVAGGNVQFEAEYARLLDRVDGRQVQARAARAAAGPPAANRP